MIKKSFSQGAQSLRESDKWDLQYRLVSAMVGECGPKGTQSREGRSRKTCSVPAKT